MRIIPQFRHVGKQSLAQEIGENLKKLREKRKLSQEE
jgi:hypothetical protein